MTIGFCFCTAEGQSKKIIHQYEKVDSCAGDISYKIYYSKLDTLKRVEEYDLNNKPTEDLEPTFEDKYFKNISVDTTQTIKVSTALKAREIAKAYFADKYGKVRIDNVKDFNVILVDNKVWCILFSFDKKSFGGTNLILISKYDGKIIKTDNLK